SIVRQLTRSLASRIKRRRSSADSFNERIMLGVRISYLVDHQEYIRNGRQALANVESGGWLSYFPLRGHAHHQTKSRNSYLQPKTVCTACASLSAFVPSARNQATGRDLRHNDPGDIGFCHCL